MFIQRRRIAANADPNAGASVAPEASDLLFEAEDVADLVAEVTGQPVDVTVDDTTVVFAVGEDEYTVEAEGDEEVLETSRKNFRGKRTVSASTKRRPATDGRAIRKYPSTGKRK